MKPNRNSSAGTKADSSTKVDDTSVSQTITKPNVVCSQSKVLPEKTFCNSERYFPTDMSLFDNHIKRRNEFDKRFGLTVKKGGLSKENYNLSRHYWALGVFD